jgi:8-oxo-dGTP pyrophosphatase MutT (NUDIX family)
MPDKERFRAYIAAYLVLIKDEQILLSKRFNTGYQDGNYSLVAGHLEGKEKAKQCIIREAFEEAGIILDSNDLEVVHVMHRFDPQREYFDIYLRAVKYSGEIKVMEPNKCDEIKWYKIDELPKNMVPEVKFALEKINDGAHYSEFGWEE